MAEKLRIVAETLEAGASVSVVARWYDASANQVYKWRSALAAAGRVALPAPTCEFVPMGVFAEVDDKMPAPANSDDGRLTAVGTVGLTGRLRTISA